MMYNLPFYPNFPPRPYNFYPPNPKNSIKNQTNPVNNKNLKKNSYKYNNINSNTNKNKANTQNSTENTTQTNNDTKILEIFGIKLLSDDILIICLLFFLYKEGVEDEYLFISLILLLLS